MSHERFADLHRASPEERARHYARATPGSINLATAENVLVFDELAPKLRDASALGLDQVKYNAAAWGSERFRGELAAFLSTSYGLTGAQRIAADDVLGLSGVSAALEAVAFSPAVFGGQRGAVTRGQVMLPTPCWQGFAWAYAYRAGHTVLRVPVSDDTHELTLAQVQAAYALAPAPKPRALVLTNPHNPLGVNYARSFLEALYTWVLDHTAMHIVSDEIYAHSQIAPVQRNAFVGALALETYAHHPAARDRVHVVWGFAKDFGLSGLKTGFLITRNRALRDDVTAGRSAWMSPFDTLKEFTIGRLLPPHAGADFLHHVVEGYRRELARAYQVVSDSLDAHGIRYARSVEAAQFFWLDLRQYLGWQLKPEGARSAADGIRASLYPEIASDDEKRLDGYFKEHANVLLLPGQTMLNAAPGFYRLCFTCEPAAQVTEAVRRMHDLVLAKLTPP